MVRYDIVILGFKTVYANGKERDMVHYAPRASANTTQTWEYIEALRPNPAKLGTINADTRNMKLAAMTALWDQIEPAYKAWKEGYEAPANGTSLRSWPALSSEQIDALARVHIRSVEDLANMPDSSLSKIQLPGMTSLKRQAGEFLANKDRSDIAKQLADAKAANEAMAEQLQAAMDLLEELKPSKRGPGRPRKDEPAETEAA